MRLEHIGIAVKNPGEAIGRLGRVLGLAPYRTQTVPSEQVSTHFLSAGGAKIELLESLEQDSAVGRFLAKRGDGIHHLAFEVDDIHAEMDRLRRDGFTLLNEAPKPGADGKLVFFVHPHDTPGLLIEFCQTTIHLPAPWIDAPHPWVDWIQAGSPLAPRLLLATASPDLPGYTLEAELARNFLVTRPADTWSEAAAGFLADLLRVSSTIRFVACVSVASALESTMFPLAGFTERLGLRVSLGPTHAAAGSPESPVLVITETDRMREARPISSSGEGATCLLVVPGVLADFCARESRLITDLVLRGTRFMVS